MKDELKFIEPELYKEIIKNMPISCVDVAIVSNGKVLLVNRKDAPAKNLWWLPGGRVIKGETMKMTALRKAKEEVGIECYVGPIIHTDETIFSDGPFDIPIHSINSCFLLYPKNPNQIPYLDNHHSDFRWINSIEENLHNYVKTCLKSAGF